MIIPLTNRGKYIIIHGNRPGCAFAPYVAERYYGEESPGFAGQDNG